VKRYADIALRLPSASEHWASEHFREELRGWVAEAVGEPSSLAPVKTRAWATVWRVQTDSGVFYAKQNCSTQSYEAALVATLNDLAPHRVVPVTAIDLDRGLLLTPDLGRTLGDGGTADVEAWCRVTAAGAQLQLEVAPHVQRLRDVGVTALAPADAVEYVEEQLDGFATLPAGDPRAMSDDDQAAVRAILPAVTRWAEQVGSLGLPLTLCHNDLHGRNVFDIDGELRFFDFADALLTEPLAALFVPLGVLADQLSAGPDDARLWRVANSGLEVWSDHAPMPELRAVLPAALQLAKLARVESWARCTVPMNAAELGEWGDAAAWWLAALCSDPPLGRLSRPGTGRPRSHRA
jgi:hypothetical protein